MDNFVNFANLHDVGAITLWYGFCGEKSDEI